MKSKTRRKGYNYEDERRCQRYYKGNLCREDVIFMATFLPLGLIFKDVFFLKGGKAENIMNSEVQDGVQVLNDCISSFNSIFWYIRSKLFIYDKVAF